MELKIQSETVSDTCCVSRYNVLENGVVVGTLEKDTDGYLSRSYKATKGGYPIDGCFDEENDALKAIGGLTAIDYVV